MEAWKPSIASPSSPASMSEAPATMARAMTSAAFSALGSGWMIRSPSTARRNVSGCGVTRMRPVFGITVVQRAAGTWHRHRRSTPAARSRRSIQAKVSGSQTTPSLSTSGMKYSRMWARQRTVASAAPSMRSASSGSSHSYCAKTRSSNSQIE